MRTDILEEFAAAQGLARRPMLFEPDELPARVEDRRDYLKAWWAANGSHVNARRRATYDRARERARKQVTYYANLDASRKRGREAMRKRRATQHKSKAEDT